ncbi:phage portal protein [Schaalia sp. lx-260]|uniref:phage portal protein n=1 Tax=Schaalia sp. lx-260 TaxID=2899082 RepID=UPI001E56BA5C|nr:phage portal protein [Schaalia sp. lx-260]MCD4549686.1 phage portal protein [Schaalia sp. lx-260]
MTTVGARKFILAHPLNVPAPKVEALTPDDQHALELCVELWRVKQPRNALRQAYLDGHITPDNLDLSVPDDISSQLGVVIGWPRKAVFGLSDLINWDGTTSKDGQDDPHGLQELLQANNFEQEIAQTIPASLTMSVAFLTLRKGNPVLGEPEVIIQGHSADWAAGLWDRVRRRISHGLTVDDVDDSGAPTRMSFYTPNITYVLAKTQTWNVVTVDAHGIGQAMIEAIPFEPSLDRPMGRSRISRDVMSITQRAMRTVIRGELAAELFTAPGILMRGVDADVFEQIKEWKWRLGSVKGVTRDEEGEIPEVTTLPQQSAQPYVDQLRALATEFAGVTSLPVSSLGVIQDNPSSAESVYAAREDLVIKAKNVQRIADIVLKRIYRHAVMLRDGLTEAPLELLGITTRWGDPAHPSIVSQSDAIVKQLQVLPWMAESTVVLEELGYSSAQIARLLADKRRAESVGILDRLNPQDQQPSTPQPNQPVQQESTALKAGGGVDSADMKARFDALGVAVRAGVEPRSAAKLLNIEGVELTGAVPVSLRLPEKAAENLEEA